MTQNWKETLHSMLPLLGHRNWIVVTDMAYPLQSGQGITTLFANEDYCEVLNEVKQAIDQATHIKANTYCDRELNYFSDTDAPGVDRVRGMVKKLFGSSITSMPHEQIIGMLDEAGRMFNVVVIKTPLTIPYTSLFFQLDCNYWDSERQARLDNRMKENNTPLFL